MSSLQRLMVLACSLSLLSSSQPTLAGSGPLRQFPASPRTAPLTDPVRQQEGEWKQKYEAYFGSTFANPLLSTAAVQTRLQQLNQQTGTRAAVIYMVPTPKYLRLFLVTAQTQPRPIQVTAAKQETLLAIARKFRQEVSDPAKVDTTSYLGPARQLYQWLIAPIAPELQNQKIDTLLLCVGPGLRSVPFAALHDGRQFLVQNYSLSLIPAFSLTDTAYTNIQKSVVLAMGASQFQELAPLPSVPEEISAIVSIRGGERFLNRQFTVANLQRQRQQNAYQIVHLATHAEFQPESVNASFIQFWDREMPLKQLPQLRLHQPPVNLLVLSACRTALGDTQAELGFAGMALQAGVNAVVGSLWYVSDLGTLELMKRFYTTLKTTPTKAAALRQAHQALLTSQRRQKGQRLSHPYYWSAFTVVGSPW